MRSSDRSRRFYRLSLLGILSAAASVIGILESYLPPLVPFVPQAKLGLANVVILFALILLDGKSAFAVMTIKCLLAAAASGASALLYSLPAGLCALLLEFVLLKTEKFSLTAVSSAGAFSHAGVQTLVAWGLIGEGALGYFPYLAFFGMLAGALTGAAAFFAVRALPESIILRYFAPQKRSDKVEKKR